MELVSKCYICKFPLKYKKTGIFYLKSIQYGKGYGLFRIWLPCVDLLHHPRVHMKNVECSLQVCRSIFTSKF